MQMIVTVSQGFAIGKDDGRLVSIPAILKWMRYRTDGQILIMGRKTLESMAGSGVIGTQKVIGLSRNPGYRCRNALILHSVDELLAELEKEKEREAFCIGGESMYRQLLPYCDTVLMTKVDYRYEANRFFPDLDRMHGWRLSEESGENTYFDLEYTCLTYEREK